MSDPTPQQAPSAPVAAPQKPDVRGVLCIRCEHLNPKGIEQCETCRGHLFVNCHECGVKNARVNARCVDCGRKLHKSRRRTARPERGVNRWLVVLVLAGILAALVALFLLSGMKLPRFS